ncbi:unnamed protein product, partial [Medioppia subpectinata]
GFCRLQAAIDLAHISLAVNNTRVVDSIQVSAQQMPTPSVTHVVRNKPNNYNLIDYYKKVIFVIVFELLLMLPVVVKRIVEDRQTLITDYLLRLGVNKIDYWLAIIIDSLTVIGVQYMIVTAILGEELITRLGLNEAIDKQALHLSGGTLRRLVLSLALIGHNDVLVLDEPTAALDPKVRQQTILVNELSFLVNRSECLGLLGTNGSGMTSTFRLLTGDLDSDSGNAYLGSDADLRKKSGQFFSRIDYCPQNDALLDPLTGMQTLVFFARIRGLERQTYDTFIGVEFTGSAISGSTLLDNRLRVPKHLAYTITLKDMNYHEPLTYEPYRLRYYNFGFCRLQAAIDLAHISLAVNNTRVVDSIQVSAQQMPTPSVTHVIRNEDITYNLMNGYEIVMLHYHKLNNEYNGQHHFAYHLLGEELITRLGLSEDIDKQALHLSGGTLRRLVLSLALIGHNDVLVLDEPTAALDLRLRQQFWDLMKDSTKNKTVLITSHDFEEANLLSDQICIISKGVICFNGTTLQMKHEFNSGYELKINKSNEMQTESLIKKIIAKYSEIKSLSKNSLGDNEELVFGLNIEQNDRFGQMFDELERNKTLLAINNMSLGMTTLEGSYAQIVSKADNNLPEDLNIDINDNSEVNVWVYWEPMVRERHQPLDYSLEIWTQTPVNRSECLGLLGTNGSGKTSTFRLLTGDLDSDSGNAYLGSDADLRVKTQKYFSQIGYCPQNDALLDPLTGIQTLVFFARIRGLERQTYDTFITNIINKFEMKAIIDKRVSTYSGGNRRKLSLAAALMGTPGLLLLDEPTNGVDPSSRLKIYKILNDLMISSNISILLTSHNMIECQILCNRLAILSKGVIKTIGFTDELKTRYAVGFDIIVKVNRDSNEAIIETLKCRMREMFGEKCVEKYSNFGLIYYNLMNSDIKLPQIFNSLQTLKCELNLEDYLVSNSSLQQVFLSITQSDNNIIH